MAKTSQSLDASSRAPDDGAQRRASGGEPAHAIAQLSHERAVLERIARSDPLESVLAALVRGHEALYPGTLGSVLLLDADGRRLLAGAAPSLPPEYSQRVHGLEIGAAVGSCGTAAFTGKTVIASDIATDERWAAARDFALGHSLRACWSTPILSGAGKVLGTFALYYREPRSPEQHELTAIESSARLAALAIEKSRVEAELRSFAERLALATRSAQMGIFDFDVKSGRLEWDEQMLSIYGVERSAFGGTYESWRSRVHPDDLEVAEARVQQSIVGDRPFESSFRIIRPDGSVRFIEARTIMQRDASGRATRMTGVNIDATAKKSLESELLRSQRLESIGRLAGGIAHDLNNMLAPMLVGPSMLRELIQDREGRALIDTIESSAQRAASVIRQLLTFSRGTDTAHAPVDCRAIVEDMLQIIRETFPRNITVRLVGSDAACTVLGDRTQLHQVLMNLCVNARDEMPSGGVLELELANVEVSPELASMHPGAQPGPFVRISVTDEGGGIEPAHMERLFEPFFTTKGVGQGTGLGLPTVLGIVKSHGGFIQVESELGKGSRFVVHLPASEMPRTEDRESRRDRLPRGHGELILIVDDEDAIRRVTQSMLQRHGYRVMLAKSGEEALVVLREQRGELSLVLTDLMMPGTDGEALVREIRARDPSVKVIVMSGNLGTSLQNPSTASQVTRVLEKPFTLELLLRTLDAALR